MFDLIRHYNRPTLQESAQKVLNASGDTCSFLSMERQNYAFWSANLSETLILAIVTDIRVDGHTCRVLISGREKFGVIILKKKPDTLQLKESCAVYCFWITLNIS